MKLVGIGEVLWDMLPTGRRAGGAPANFAYFASLLGHEGIVVSAVGNDRNGHELRRLLEDAGLTLEVMTSCCYPTGRAGIIVDADGVPSYSILENTAYDNIFYTRQLEAVAATADAVCFGTLAQRTAASRATIRLFLDRCRTGCLKVFDANLRQAFYSRDVIDESLSRCDILKINHEEESVISDMLGLSTEEIFNRYNLSHLIVTHGEEGSQVRDRHGISTLPTKKVEVVDTVGAGDAFTAAFVTAILEGSPTEEAHRHAVDFSAESCTRAGTGLC